MKKRRASDMTKRLLQKYAQISGATCLLICHEEETIFATEPPTMLTAHTNTHPSIFGDPLVHKVIKSYHDIKLTLIEKRNGKSQHNAIFKLIIYSK